MLFTTLALLFFVQDHIRWSAAACIVLVLVKETGVALPLVLMAWLAARAAVAGRRLVPALLRGAGHLADRAGARTPAPGREARISSGTTSTTRCTRSA